MTTALCLGNCSIKHSITAKISTPIVPRSAMSPFMTYGLRGDGKPRQARAQSKSFSCPWVSPKTTTLASRRCWGCIAAFATSPPSGTRELGTDTFITAPAYLARISRSFLASSRIRTMVWGCKGTCGALDMWARTALAGWPLRNSLQLIVLKLCTPMGGDGTWGHCSLFNRVAVRPTMPFFASHSPSIRSRMRRVSSALTSSQVSKAVATFTSLCLPF
mmetsp:Transcript_12018/g.26719  ORF Transcript_12018/g.26719 Transcript_12018/m.26719 type:complete len:218 (-) Transcript_12018:679-1332(-)